MVRTLPESTLHPSLEKWARVKPLLSDLRVMRSAARKVLKEYGEALKLNPTVDPELERRFQIADCRIQEIGNIRGSVLGLLEPECPFTPAEQNEVAENLMDRIEDLKNHPDQAGLHTQHIGSAYWYGSR